MHQRWGLGPLIGFAKATFVNRPAAGGALSRAVMQIGTIRDITSIQQGRPPIAIRVPAPLPGWFAKEMGGGDVHPELTPFFAVRKLATKIIGLAPIDPIAPNPQQYDVAAKTFVFRSGPIDILPQVPDGPTF